MTETTNYEQVVMTPKTKTLNSTVLLIERKVNAQYIGNGKVHVAGGDHTGIVINKEISSDNGDIFPAQLSLEFRVFLVSGQTGKHTQESRILRYWFRMRDNKNLLNETEQATVAQEFFKELVSPQEFPRDYVGFIKKIMKLMQHKYENISKLEVELRQLEEIIVPNRPLSSDENSLENATRLSQEKVLELIESSYPNPLTISDMTKKHSWDKDEVVQHMQELEKRGLVKAMEHGAYTRQQSTDNRVTIVKQMPTISSAKQPTIAVITAQYCEKLAVDAMIENKTTYVRYTTVGESNVYTLGNIGAHRIVSTKLPSVGHTREAMTAAGNTTTRLLGTFQKVDYVFLVGVGGGVPHYTDYNKHVRLGDVVVSSPGSMKDAYLYCDKVKKDDKGYSFEVKPYSPANLKLQEIASQLKVSTEDDLKIIPPWVNYLHDGLELLKKQPEALFERPSSDTDKLYMSIGERDLIEVAHPAPQDTSLKRFEGQPKIHFSPVASGRQIVRDDQIRQLFSGRFGVLAFDCEFDSVIESILGNCKDSFVCIRGISDYKDGSRRKEWQPYASLVAASFMKAIVCSMEPPTNV